MYLTVSTGVNYLPVLIINLHARFKMQYPKAKYDHLEILKLLFDISCFDGFLKGDGGDFCAISPHTKGMGLEDAKSRMGKEKDQKFLHITAMLLWQGSFGNALKQKELKCLDIKYLPFIGFILVGERCRDHSRQKANTNGKN